MDGDDYYYVDEAEDNLDSFRLINGMDLCRVSRLLSRGYMRGSLSVDKAREMANQPTKVRVR